MRINTEENLNAAISQLAELATGSHASEEILRIVKEIIRIAKLPNGRLRSGMMLYRARINEVGKAFCNIDEISYIRQADSITRYGRANRPGKSLFYCSDDAMTAFMETVNQRLRENLNDAGSVTIGYWRAVRPVENIGGILDSSDTLTRLFPPDCEAAKAMQLLLDNKHRWQFELWSKSLDYLVARFTEVVTDQLRYQITSAIFEALMGDSVLGGIAYPSVLSEALGINYALTPLSSDTRLKLVDVVRIDFKKEGDSVEIREKVSDHFYRNGSFKFDA